MCFCMEGYIKNCEWETDVVVCALEFRCFEICSLMLEGKSELNLELLYS